MNDLDKLADCSNDVNRNRINLRDEITCRCTDNFRAIGLKKKRKKPKKHSFNDDNDDKQDG